MEGTRGRKKEEGRIESHLRKHETSMLRAWGNFVRISSPQKGVIGQGFLLGVGKGTCKFTPVEKSAWGAEDEF